MVNIDLKAYTTRAVELEAAIYTQRKLMSTHETIIKERRPIAPIKNVPIRPVQPKPSNASPYKANYGSYFVIGVMLLVGILSIPLLRSGERFWGVVGIVLGLAAIGGICTEYDQKKQANQQYHTAQEKYKEELAEYSIQLEQYRNDVTSSENTHLAELENYRIKLSTYNNESTSIMTRHNEILEQLEKALEALYDENVIFPKYRNMVAIAVINEYLQSGRCSELEGANGAYNLYEMELRQNIIIGQLSTIIDNLEQIRNNQFTLYRELIKANEQIEQLTYELRNLHTTTKLTAYFAKVTALAAISPKFYTTYTF